MARELIKPYLKDANLMYQPAIVSGLPEIEDGEVAYNDFWETQIDRFVNGYKPSGGVWINGFYYLYLNFLTVDVYDQRIGRKFIGPPLYRDIDHELFAKYDQAKKEKKGIILLKARRKGFTTDLVGLVLSQWLIYPGSTQAVGAYVEDHVSRFRNRIVDMRETLPPELYQTAQPDSEDLMKSTYETKDENGNWKKVGNKSEIHFGCFGHKPGIFRGLSLDTMVIDEAGENPKLKLSLLENEEAFKEGKEMFGTPVIGGTANMMSTPGNDFEKMYYNAEDYGLLRHFVPASKWYYPFVDFKTGKSKMKEAEKDIEEDHARLRKYDDKTQYFTKLQEMPLEPKHCFMGDSSQKLDIDKIEMQIDKIETTPEIKDSIRRGRLEFENGYFSVSNPKVNFIDDEMGDVWVYQEPNDRYQNLDIGGVDTYFANNAPSSPSMGSCFIYRRYHPSIPSEMPIAEYTARESTTEEFYLNCLKMAIYYDCQLLVEYDESFGKYFSNIGANRWLKERPQSADSQYSNSENRYMIHMKVHQKSLLTNLLRDYVKTHCENINFVELLREMRVFGNENTDRVMAFGICLIHSLDVKNIYVRDKVAIETDEDSYGFPTFGDFAGRPIPN